MALFDKTLQDAGLSFFRDSPNRTPTVIIQDWSQRKIAILDAMASGNNAFTGDVNTPDIRYSVYSTGAPADTPNSGGWRLTPLSKAAGNFLNPQAGYVAHGSNFFYHTIPAQILLANSSMACGLLANVVGDGANSTGEFTGYMHTLNNWNRCLNRERKATKLFDIGYSNANTQIFTYGVFPTSVSTRAGSALEHDVNTQIRYFDANTTVSYPSAVTANSIIGGMGGGTAYAGGGAGSQQTTTPWWSTFNLDFIEYMSQTDRIIGVTVRNGSTSTLQKVQPGGGGLFSINNATQKGATAVYANLYAVANSTTGRVANTLGLETNPSLTFVARPKIISYGDQEFSNTTYMFVNSRVASFSAGLVDVSTNVFSNAVAFTITSGTDNKWCGTPSMLYQRTGDAATTVRFAMSEIQALNAGRRIREYTFATTTAVAAAQGNSVTFANTSWETPTGTTTHSDSTQLFGYLATITSTIGGNNTPTITQIPIETWNRPSSFLTNNNMIRWATAYITTTGNGIEAVDSANSYLPPQPPLAVYPITEDQSQLLVMYNEFAEFVELQPIPGVTPTVYGKWVRTSTYPYPLRTASIEYIRWSSPEPKPIRMWAYDRNGAIHVFNLNVGGGGQQTTYATFTMANTIYEYTGNVISTSGTFTAYRNVPSANVIAPNAQTTISLIGGGLRFSDNTITKTVTANSLGIANVALQVVGPGSTQIYIQTQIRNEM